MKGNEGFKRMSINEMRAKREEAEQNKIVSTEFDKWIESVDSKVAKEQMKVIREMGYGVHDEMTPLQYQLLDNILKADGISFDIAQNYNNATEQLTVEIRVVQVARTITFDFKGGETNGSND